MPINPVQEFWNKGLVTVRDATLLAPGELQQCDHCVYRPFDPAIHAAPGRQAIHSTPFSGPIKGLAWLSSDLTLDQLLVYNGTNIYLTPFTAITGLVWTQVYGVGTLSNTGTERMDMVKYDSAYYLLNGVNAPRRIGRITPIAKDVTTCTISGGTTVTSSEADIFTDLQVGQGVTGGGFPAGTVITAKNFTVTAGAYNVTSLTMSAAGTNGAASLSFSATAFTSGRISGMLPIAAVDTAPTIISGTWPNSGSFGGAGSYWFFYTEAFIPTTLDDYANGFIESACVVSDKNLRRIDITTPTTQAVRFTRNTNLMNDGTTDSTMATHWIVYMSPKSSDPLVIPSRNNFVRIGSPVPISKTTVDITTTATSTAFFFATAVTNPAPGFTAVTNPNGALQQGGGYAFFGEAENDALLLRTFGIPTSALAVTGIEFETNLNGILQVTLQRMDAAGTTVVKQSTSVPIIRGALIGWGVRTWGGEYETFTPSPSGWVGSDFFDSGAGTFRILLRKASNQGASLDYLRIRIHYDGFPPNTLGAPYRTVTYRSQVGTTIVDSAALPPPIGASTGAVFRSQQVFNSPTRRNAIVYSQPGFPEYFPAPYTMTFDTNKKDVVTNIKRVGRMLVVGLQDSVNRVNYLPTELDTDGQSGLAYEPIATDHGITGPKAAVVVDIPDLGTVLAYASFKGIHYTDGIRSRFLNVDLNWKRLINMAAASTIELAVYPAMNWIVMYYCPFGAAHTRNTRALIFDYSPDKLKQGTGGVTLPAIGPMTVSGRCAAAATLAGEDYLLTGHEDSGLVYAEDQGSTLPTGYYTQEAANPATQTVTKNVPVIRSRLFYAAGVERDAREERVYLRYDTNGNTVLVTGCTLAGTTVTKTNSLGSVVAGMTVSGVGIPPGTIVLSVTGDDVANLNQAVEIAGTADITFDTGTIKVTIRGQGMRDAVATIESGYLSTFEGNLNCIHLDNARQALEIKIEKVALDDNSLVDLGTAMRLHYFTALLSEDGMEMGRP